MEEPKCKGAVTRSVGQVASRAMALISASHQWRSTSQAMMSTTVIASITG